MCAGLARSWARGGARACDSVAPVRDLRRRLIVPAFATVTSFTAACPEDPPRTTETDGLTEASDSNTDGPTSTGTDTDDATGGAVPDCDMATEKAMCEAMGLCLWEDLGGICVTDCAKIDDEAQCGKADYCEWYDGVCYPPI